MSDSSPPEDMVLQRLMHLHAEIAEYRKQVEAELAVLRARQDQQDVFNRGIALFMVEVQGDVDPDRAQARRLVSSPSFSRFAA